MKACAELVGEVCTVWLRGREQEITGTVVSSSAWHLVLECTDGEMTTVWYIDAGDVVAIGCNE